MEREINTRNDVVKLLLDWLRPLKRYYSPGAAWLMVGETASHYDRAAARMEGYARVLWGLGPLFSGKYSNLPSALLSEIGEWKELALRRLINGTDTEHEEYWGDVQDYNQRMVEMAAVVNAMLLAPDVLWAPLTKEQKQNVCRWLNQINAHAVHANNWRFFRILVNMFFRKQGEAYSQERMEEDWKVIEGCYEGGGWYFDGHEGQKDYYIPFAMHYYGLLYAVHERDAEPERCRVLQCRAAEFFGDFLYWFDAEGREVPFGRSLTYRFAHSAFFAAAAYAGVEVSLPVLKHMLLGNLRYWSSQPIFDNGGVLTVGYQYPNLMMSENYNAQGSPYWGLKTFLILALPEEHEFWSCAEERPDFVGKRLLEHPHMLSVHEEDGHTLLYPAGQHSYNLGNMAAKYQKLVYSNRFGFSVARGTSLEEGAFDNTLAATAAGENFWRVRGGAEWYEVTEQDTRLCYELMRGVKVETVVVPLKRGHVRVHFISSRIDVELADGGFAICTEMEGQGAAGWEKCPGKKRSEKKSRCCVEGRKASCVFPWGNAGAVCLGGMGEARLVKAFPNTNLMHGRTVIPTVYYRLPAGEFCLVDYFYGDGRAEEPKMLPELVDANDERFSALGGDVQKIAGEADGMVRILYGTEGIVVRRK